MIFKIRMFLVLFFLNHFATGQIATNALYFDGVDDYVSLPALPFFTSLGTNPFTIEAWIRCDAGNTNDEYTIISTRDEATFIQGFKICIEGGYLSFTTASGNFYQFMGGGQINDGLCHHIALVKETTVSGYKAYIDGVLYPLATNSSYLSSTILPTIGRTNEQLSQWESGFTGVIKELRVWSVGRTQSQIQTNVNVVVPYNSSNLVHYWRFNEGIGSTINDYSTTVGGGTGSFGIGTQPMWTNSCNGCLYPPPAATINPSGSVIACNTITLLANTGTSLTYQWKKNGVNISGATGNSLSVSSSGSYSVVVTKICNSTTSNPVSVTISTAVPSTPGSITTSGGSTKVCPGQTRTYSVTSVANATSYTWTAPQGGVIQSGQGTNSVIITYNSGFTVTDTLRVKANNICGSSIIRKLTIVRNNPAKPSAITGNNYGLCNASAIPYSVTNVAGITYNWSFSVVNTSIVSGQGTNAITANYSPGFLTGVLNVTAANGCGVSAARTLSVYAKPATPVSITGPVQVCVNQQNVPYSITPLFGATSYTWISPAGATVSNGTLTANTITSTATSVLVDYASTSGYVRARGNNSCASGSNRSLAVTFNCREAAGEYEEEPISIYPNPFDEELVIDGTGFSEARIFDSQGRLVYQTDLFESTQTLKPELPNGAYMITLISGSEIKTYRLVRIGNSGKN